MIRFLRHWWRQLRGRCILCGDDRTRVNCALYPEPLACHTCNKRIRHGTNYAMSPSRQRRLVNESDRTSQREPHGRS